MFDQLDKRIKEIVKSEMENVRKMQGESDMLTGLQLATVVDTIDPLKRGRIRFYTPFLSERATPIEGLPWASPISSFGGFDDSGCTWVPPAGSKVAVLFHNGNKESAYYIGTIWSSHRGSDGNHLSFWDNRPIPEYDCLWEGKRKGYLVGDNTGDQVFPPWNTEMYNGYDTDSFTDFYSSPIQYRSETYPYIYGWKTNNKHGSKYVDGDAKCNNRWSRVEHFTGRGNMIMMKDDHMHPGGQWAFGSNFDLVYCRDSSEVAQESVCCDGSESQSPCTPTSCRPRECPDATSGSTNTNKSKFSNPFFKRQEEMRFYQGANTPQRNKCELDQSGMQFQSISGHQIIFDDSVDQPNGVPSWDRDFDFGCTDIYKGKMQAKSATGHVWKFDDTEDVSKVRSPNNGFSVTTASGNFFELNDHTTPNPDRTCTQLRAGENSGATIRTRSSHVLRMSDFGIEQHSEPRQEGGVPDISGDGYNGYVLLRSGYGIQILMKDANRQDQTENQLLHIMSPQKDNEERGAHMLVMQEQAEGPGVVMLRAGGYYYLSSYDDSVEVVGSDEHEANKFSTISGSELVDIKKYYFNHNDTTIFFSEQHIFLLAGRDCPRNPDASASQSNSQQDINNAQSNPGSASGKSDKEPCIYNVITSKDPWACPFTGAIHFGIVKVGDQVLDSRSERVFASAKPKEEEE